jgi:hypothetical protein
MTIRRTTLIVFCFLLLPRFPAFATSIVAIVGEKSITIAADSIVIGNSIETGERVRVSECKIRCVDRGCFAASGRYGNNTIGYDLWQLAETELRSSGSPNEMAERFKTVIGPLIPRLVAVSKEETPRTYAEWLKGSPVLAYLFAGFDGTGEPLVVSEQVMIDTEGRVLPIRESVRQGRMGTIGAVALGRNLQIADFINRNPTWTVSATMQPTDFAERMIRLEIRASEDAGRRDVGEPIAVVTLYANGFTLERVKVSAKETESAMDGA